MHRVLNLCYQLPRKASGCVFVSYFLAPTTPDIPANLTAKVVNKEEESNERHAVEDANEQKSKTPKVIKAKTKTPVSKKLKDPASKTKVKAKALPGSSKPTLEKSKKPAKISVTKDDEKNNSCPSKLKSEQTKASKVVPKPKSGVKAKVGTSVKTATKVKSASLVDENKKSEIRKDNPESQRSPKVSAKPVEKKKVAKNVVKKVTLKTAKTTIKAVKSSSATASKDKKQDSEIQKKSTETTVLKIDVKKEIMNPDETNKPKNDQTKSVKQMTTGKKRPASSKPAASDAKKAKPNEKKPVRKAKTSLQKKSSVKPKNAEIKPKVRFHFKMFLLCKIVYKNMQLK